MKANITKLLTRKKKSAKSDIQVLNFEEAHGRYSEAYSMGTEFALLSPENEVIHKFTYCKDFISDIYYGFHFNKAVQVYGFAWDPQKNKNPSVSPAKILIRDKKLESPEVRAPQVERFLQMFEKALGIEQLSKCIWLDKQKCLYIESSSEWVSFPAMVSLWTLAMRVGFRYYNHEDMVGKKRKIALDDILSKILKLPALSSCPAGDSYKVKEVLEVLHALEKGLYKKSLESKSFEAYKNSTINSFHNGSGVVSIARDLKKKKPA